MAFLSIAVVGFVAAVLFWWLRVRRHTRRRGLERMATWPWDHDRLGARHGTLDRECGLGIYGGGGDSGGAHGLARWDPDRISYDDDEKQFDIGVASPEPGLAAYDPQSESYYHAALPPAPAPAHPSVLARAE